jgi:hypothetical protein
MRDEPVNPDATEAEAGPVPSATPGSLDVDAVQRALLVLATGDVDGAVDVVRSLHAVDEEVRTELARALVSAHDLADGAQALGDRLLAGGFGRDLANEAYRAAFYLSGRSERLAENPLYAWFLAHRSGAPVDKWVHYFPIYERHLERFRGRGVRVLEIGVYRGGGLAMWQQYLGPEATVIGLDVDETARRAVGDSFVVEIGDQADQEVLRRVERAHGPFDIVIDDGGHRMEQQRATVETLFPLLADDGVLVVEDCHTSYWPEYGGGLGAPTSFLEWVKARVDDIHALHAPGVPPDSIWATHLDGLHIYDSVVVLDKADRFRPFSEMSGTSTYLRADRPSEGHLIDLIGARDAARAQVEELEAEIARLHGSGLVARTGGAGEAEPAPAEPIDDELRRVQAALRWSQSELAEVGRRAASLEQELASTNGRLLESWEQIRLMRRSVSWRLTAPIRVVRGLRR